MCVTCGCNHINYDHQDTALKPGQAPIKPPKAKKNK